LVTTGGDQVISGWARFERRPWIFIALVSLVVVLVNASSDYLELRRGGHDTPWWEPVIWEVTSALVIVSMAPLIGMAVRRWPPTRDNLIRPLLIHLGLTIPFAMGHVAAIYVMRTAIYAVVGGEYGYFDDGLGLVLLYEWRKDVLTYATIAAVYWMFDYIAARRQAAAIPTSGDQRIEIRDGGAAVFLAPAEITHVEAAGNYVEFHTPARTHLVRGTLASWEAQLTARGFARVHRSRLVNRTRISAIKPTPSGDIEITLDTGAALTGSRRYRDALA
jgi:hypothetical protein